VAAPVVAWDDAARHKGFRLCIASNSLTRRVKLFERLLGVPAISKAIKPRRSAFLRALARIQARPEEAVVVGDQLFTDVLGAKRAGLLTILVAPLSKGKLPHTRLARMLERMILKE